MSTNNTSNLSTNIFNKLPIGVGEGTGVDQDEFTQLIDKSRMGTKFGARVLTVSINVLNRVVGKTKIGGKLVKYLEGKLTAKIHALVLTAQKTSQAAQKLTSQEDHSSTGPSNTNFQATEIPQEPQPSQPEPVSLDDNTETTTPPKEANPIPVANLVLSQDLEALKNHESLLDLSCPDAIHILKDQPNGKWLLRIGSAPEKTPTISLVLKNIIQHYRFNHPNSPGFLTSDRIPETEHLSLDQIRDIQEAHDEALVKKSRDEMAKEGTPSHSIPISILSLNKYYFSDLFKNGKLHRQSKEALRGQQLQDLKSLNAAGVTQVKNVQAPENGKITVTLAGETQALHANRMNTPEGNFIVAQVPKHRHDLFWKAAVDEASLIVDLTHPGAQLFNKAPDIDPYYPTEIGITYNAGEHVSVTLKESTPDENDSDLVISIYTVTIDGIDHNMTRIHYRAWVDHNTTGTGALKNIVTVMYRIKGTSEKPIAIHCTAGIGRSGTVITAARIMKQKTEGKFDTANPVQNVDDMIVEGRVARGGEPGLSFVQRSAQYRTILEIAAELDRQK